MAEPKVYILDDTYELVEMGYITTLPDIVGKKTFGRDKIIDSKINLKVKNIDNFFSFYDTNSIFSDYNWRFTTVKIYSRDNELVYEGLLEDIEVNPSNGSAVLKIASALTKFSEVNVVYESSDWETPADAFKNICDQIGFSDYNLASVNRSKAIFEENNCYIKCHFESDDDINFIQAIEKIAEIGTADCFSWKNELFFELWEAFNLNIITTLDENSILNFQSIQTLKDKIVNDYIIGYVGDAGISLTDFLGDNLGLKSREKFGTRTLRAIDGSEYQQIEIKDKTSALFIGNTWIKRTQKNLLTNPEPLIKIRLKLKIDEAYNLDLNSIFILNCSWLNFQNKLFKVAEIRKNDFWIDVVAYEVITND